jgi:hypothetical protein
MLTAVPKSWFSWNFILQAPARRAVGEVRLSSWRERGAVVVDGVTYRIRRDGWTGPFTMETADGAIVASATKPSAFRREFEVVHDGQRYGLSAVSSFRREFAVFRGDSPIGSIAPASWFGRRANVQCAEDLPVHLRAFLVWLTLLLWKRDADASS